MKKLSTLFVATILSGAIVIMPAFAKDSVTPAQAAKLRTEISALQTEIAKNKPSLTAKIEKRISGWVHKFEGLGGKKS